MAIYRTARGQTVDMAALASKNDKARAVSNMTVNARGDTIDSTGKIVQPVARNVTNAYRNSVATRSNNIVTRKTDVAQVTEELSEAELEFEMEDAETDALIEEIKSAEVSTAIPEYTIKSADEAPDFFEPEPAPTPTVKSTRKGK